VISSHTCVSVVARNTTESQADKVTQPIFGSASKVSRSGTNLSSTISTLIGSLLDQSIAGRAHAVDSNQRRTRHHQPEMIGCPIWRYASSAAFCFASRACILTMAVRSLAVF
jgi:hypothetical protein